MNRQMFACAEKTSSNLSSWKPGSRDPIRIRCMAFGAVCSSPLEFEGGGSSARAARRSAMSWPLSRYRARLQPVTTSSLKPASRKARARSRTASYGIDTGLPLNCGTMQKEHLPLHPSCILIYARLVARGTGHVGTVPCGFSVRSMASRPLMALGRQPVATICASGCCRRSLAISFSQSCWALAVTLQQRTIIVSTIFPGPSMSFTATTRCPSARNRASMSSASAWFSLQPNVTKATRMKVRR